MLRITQETAIKHHMGLYASPRVAMVEQFLRRCGEKRPIPVADILPVILMNYGVVEFHHAQAWFEAGAARPVSTTGLPLLMWARDLGRQAWCLAPAIIR